MAQCWNLLAGYAGLISVGQQAFVGLGGYALFALIILLGFDPLVAVLIGAAIVAVLCRADRVRRLPPAGRLFRGRSPGSWRKSSGSSSRSGRQLGGGTGNSLPRTATIEHARARAGRGAVRRAHRPRRARSSSTGLALIARRRHHRGGLLAAALAARPRAQRHPRLARWRRRASASTSSRRSSRSTSSPASAPGSRARSIFLQQGAHLARRRRSRCSTGPPTSSSSSSSAASAPIEGPILGAIIFCRAAVDALELRRLVPA